jgi:hypothetical protein
MGARGAVGMGGTSIGAAAGGVGSAPAGGGAVAAAMGGVGSAPAGGGAAGGSTMIGVVGTAVPVTVAA